MKINLRIKKIVKKNTPDFILNIYRKSILKKKIENISKLSREEKFSYIYKNNIWGGRENFNSGDGSHNPNIIQPYIEIVKKFLEKNDKPTLIDCGCGDFNVGKNFLSSSKKYYAIDIFQDIIDLNKSKFKHENLQFLKLDIVEDNIPSGDVCIVRQTLQHLSNQDIHSFLKNIKNKFKFLLVTEHLPDGKFKSNIDMKTSFLIRPLFNSGILLHEKPFEIKFKHMDELLRVSAAPDEGVISTILYEL